MYLKNEMYVSFILLFVEQEKIYHQRNETNGKVMKPKSCQISVNIHKIKTLQQLNYICRLLAALPDSCCFIFSTNLFIWFV